MKAGVKGHDQDCVDAAPFDSAHTYMATLDRTYWEQRIEDLSGQGLRVLAAAVRRADDRGTPTSLTIDDVDASGFTFLGLYGIMDPPREEAIDAIRACHDAGIRVARGIRRSRS